MAKIAARLMTGRKLREFLPEYIERGTDLDTGRCFYVKSPVFPWSNFPASTRFSVPRCAPPEK